MLTPLPNDRRKSQDEAQLQTELKKPGIIYVPIVPIYGKGEAREEEFSDGFS